MKKFSGNLPLFTKLSQNLQLELKSIVANAKLTNVNDHCLVIYLIEILDRGINVGDSTIGSVFSEETKRFSLQHNMSLWALNSYVNSQDTFLSDAYKSEMAVCPGNPEDPQNHTTTFYQIS